jgi:hypothetical protein
MIALGWLLLLSAEPVTQRPATEFTRAGIVCTESVEPRAVPLIGEVRLTLTAEGDAPLAVDPLTLSDPQSWRIRSAEPATISDRGGGKQQWRASFRLTPEKPGDVSLSPPAIRVRAGSRETPVEIDWPPFIVTVTTTLPRADLDEAHGVTGPEAAPPTATPLWMDERCWAAAIVLIAVLTAILAGRCLRRPAAPEPPPSEWAAAELDRLAGFDPAESSSADALANLLRGFLVRARQIPAAGKTTVELLALLRSRPGKIAADWGLLLERCDLARFANAGFTADEWANTIQQARSLTAASLPVGEATVSTVIGPTRENT